MWVQNPEWVSNSPRIHHPASLYKYNFFSVSTCLAVIIILCYKAFSKGRALLGQYSAVTKAHFIIHNTTLTCFVSLRMCKLTPNLFKFCISNLEWFVSLELSQVDGGVDSRWDVFGMLEYFTFVVFSGNYMCRLSMRDIWYNSKESCVWLWHMHWYRGQQWGQKGGRGI